MNELPWLFWLWIFMLAALAFTYGYARLERRWERKRDDDVTTRRKA